MSTWKIGPDLEPLFHSIASIAKSLETIAKAAEGMGADKQPDNDNCPCSVCEDVKRERYERLGVPTFIKKTPACGNPDCG